MEEKVNENKTWDHELAKVFYYITEEYKHFKMAQYL